MSLDWKSSPLLFPPFFTGIVQASFIDCWSFRFLHYVPPTPLSMVVQASTIVRDRSQHVHPTRSQLLPKCLDHSSSVPLFTSDGPFVMLPLFAPHSPTCLNTFPLRPFHEDHLRNSFNLLLSVSEAVQRHCEFLTVSCTRTIKNSVMGTKIKRETDCT